MNDLVAKDVKRTSLLTARLLDEIYSKREVQDASGRCYKLHSEITPDEGKLISSLISDHRIHRTLEIGCAYGLSSLYICQAIAEFENPAHTIIDPYQRSEWTGIGITNLDRAGCNFFQLIEECSELALPDLILKGDTYQFILIDGYHTFDQTLVDFYFANRLLEQGGIIVMDDVHLPAVRKVARFVAKLPNYQVIVGARPFQRSPSWRKRLANTALRGLARILPASVSENAFADSLFHSDLKLGTCCEMVAFRKIAADKRDSHWHTPF